MWSDVIVMAGGPTDDYLDDTVALRLRASGSGWRTRQLGAPELGLECVGDPWLLEPDLDALVAALRWTNNRKKSAAAASSQPSGRKRGPGAPPPSCGSG